MVLKWFPIPQYLKMPATGIDISDRSFKYMELSKKKERFLISQYGTKFVPAGIIESGEIKDKNKFVEFLKSINSELKIKFVNVSLPEEKAFISKINLPIINEDEIRSAIEFQLEEHIPLSANDAVFDFEILKKDDRKKVLSVNVAAVPKTLVEGYRDSFLASGFMPISFETETQSFSRVMVAKEDNASYFLIDFGRTRTAFAVVSEKKVQFSSYIKIGGDNLNEALKKNLDVDIMAAENIKKEKGMVKRKGNEKVFDSLLMVVAVIKDEARRLMDYWNSHINEEQKTEKGIEKMLLAGGDSNLIGFPEYLSYELKIPVELCNPWINVFSFEENIPEIELKESLTYVGALGLALKSQ